VSVFREEVAGGVATVTLDRPDKLNALTFEVYAELRDWFAGVGARADVRAIVLTGAGRGFCSGGDVHEIIGKLFEKDMAGLLEFTRMTGALVENIRRCPKPVVAAVNGVAAGAGAVIAAACDLRVLSDAASFAFLFVKVGLSGADMGAAWLLPRLVGFGRAAELLLTGEKIDATEAHRIGLANRVVPTERVLAEAHAIAEKLARGPAFGVAMTKEMMNAEADLTLGDAIEAEAQAQAICMQHPDFREFYEAFVAKRPPRFG